MIGRYRKGVVFMNLLYTPVTGWKWPWERPTNYGWYHILWLVLMIAITVFLCLKFARKHDEKIDNRVIFSFGAFLVAIELYKQIFYTVEAGRYMWYAFPYQFCSIPMFVAFIAPLIKQKKVQDAMYKFIAIFGLLAGLAVMAYPDSCFGTDYITILLHTMMWHASMVIIGIYLIVAKKYCSNIKSILKEIGPGAIVFTIVVSIALIANIVGYYAYFGTPANVHGDKLFLMYISPWYECPFPILGALKEQLPFPVFFLLYLLAFVLGISILWFAVFGIRKLVNLIANKTKKSEQKPVQ